MPIEVALDVVARGGFPALVSLMVWLIYTGRFVPGKWLDRESARADKLQAALDKYASQNQQLFEATSVMVDFLKSAKGRTEEDR